MYCSQREFDLPSSAVCDDAILDPELKDPQNRTALDAAVLESIIHTNIHKLADLLHVEGSREDFMAWLWNLTDFNCSGVVTLQELRVFLKAVSEDGIDLTELAFHREGGVPLEESIINEFDTTHAGMLSRDEFMVLADLVTREYEFWENRHLERVGDYELGRTIGRGSSGVVRLAMHVETREKVAIKIIKKGKCSDLSRLDREIQSLKAAHHQHIVALKEVLDSDCNLFIVMELCGGGSMVDIVRLYQKERMPEETARFFVRQVFDALAFCHKNGICHRDIRLDNLMLDNSGNVKITDFGHSGIYTPGWDFFSTSLVGSVYNLSPEQIMGRVYSGEKIDVWSAGVAVYCLLVGQPPFFDLEVNSLLEKIAACDFETPDFLSANAKDLIQCMIRALPDERISIQQMLHHPWFYDGPEYGPSMNVVVIPVDRFFKTRPDIAEMILAITIYQHSLHFHLADTDNPKSSPEDQRGQDWTLKCLCPKNDIKFTVSLFTKKPCDMSVKTKKNGILPSPVSYSALTDKALLNEIPGSHLRPTTSCPRGGTPAITRRESLGNMSPLNDMDSGHGLPRRDAGSSARDSSQSLSSLRPPRLKRFFKVTPLNVAAHLRESKCTGNNDIPDIFDLEPDGVNTEYSTPSCQDDLLLDSGTSSEKKKKHEEGCVQKKNGRSHSRSHSLDGPGGLMRVNRSATVDAFPYQKVYPQRKMPESARRLNFDRPESPSMEQQGEKMGTNQQEASAGEEEGTSPRRGNNNNRERESDITSELCRHPLKGISPQSPQVRRLAGVPHESLIENVEALSLSPRHDATKCSVAAVAQDANRKITNVEKVIAVGEPEFQAYIEVRLQDGESGLFLKICRKLKTICITKLAAAAERQKKKNGNRRIASGMRRTSSANSMDGEGQNNGEGYGRRELLKVGE